MDEWLDAFLYGREPGTSDGVGWGNGLRLEVSGYLGEELPPRPWLTSARAVVTRADAVLVAEDADGTRHILPGGQLEDGETPEEAVCREIAEETGWLVGRLAPIGFLHFRHLTPKPAGYRYPWPVFMQVVYHAEAERSVPERVLDDDYVVNAEFLAFGEVGALPLSPVERLFLDALRGRMR